MPLLVGNVYLTIILILFALFLIGLIGSVAVWHSLRKEQKASKALIIKVGFLVPISFWGPIYLSMYILNELNNDLSVVIKIVIIGIAVLATIYAALKLLEALLKPSFDNEIDTWSRLGKSGVGGTGGNGKQRGLAMLTSFPGTLLGNFPDLPRQCFFVESRFFPSCFSSQKLPGSYRIAVI